MTTLLDFMELDRDAAAAEALAEAIRRLPVIDPPRIIWKRYRTTAGRAYFHEGTICLSSVLLDTPERIRETVLHEYAHHAVFQSYGPRAQSHGREWRSAMRKLGLKPDVHHAYACQGNQVSKRVVVKCRKCGEEILRVRPLKRNRIYSHIGCGGRIVSAGRLQDE
jgi:predicted SprT family Zn-dependent metalloprotease